MVRSTQLLVLVCLAGCGGFGGRVAPGLFPEVPTDPNYEQHISLLMTEYCDQCHSEPNENANDFVSLQFQSEGGVEGVFDARTRILERAVEGAPSPMPPFPVRGWSAIEQETFVLWLDNGAPEAPAAP